MLKTYASNLMKISNDLRLLSSGPAGGINEINLPTVQKGSSIMPGKINPVILESVIQVAMKVINNDNLISNSAGLGNLEINQYLPLITHSFLENIELLIKGTNILKNKCIDGIKANKEIALNYVMNSKTIATVFVPKFGYKKVEKIVKKAIDEDKSIKKIILEENLLSERELDQILSPWNMYKMGYE